MHSKSHNHLMTQYQFPTNVCKLLLTSSNIKHHSYSVHQSHRQHINHSRNKPPIVRENNPKKHTLNQKKNPLPQNATAQILPPPALPHFLPPHRTLLRPSRSILRPFPPAHLPLSHPPRLIPSSYPAPPPFNLDPALSTRKSVSPLRHQRSAGVAKYL